MKTTVTYDNFRDAFRNYDRLSHFPNDGLRVLWDFLEGYEADTGEEIELDVVGLCCDYCQMTFEDVAREYNIDIDENEPLNDQVEQYLHDNTLLVGTVGADQVIFQCF